MVCVHCFEEAVCERKMSKLIAFLVVKNAHPVMQNDGTLANTSIELVLFFWPFDSLWFCCAHEHWQMDVNFE